jgi:hypothetical protein
MYLLNHDLIVQGIYTSRQTPARDRIISFQLQTHCKLPYLNNSNMF